MGRRAVVSPIGEAETASSRPVPGWRMHRRRMCLPVPAPTPPHHPLVTRRTNQPRQPHHPLLSISSSSTRWAIRSSRTHHQDDSASHPPPAPTHRSYPQLELASGGRGPGAATTLTSQTLPALARADIPMPTTAPGAPRSVQRVPTHANRRFGSERSARNARRPERSVRPARSLRAVTDAILARVTSQRSDTSRTVTAASSAQPLGVIPDPNRMRLASRSRHAPSRSP